MSDLDEPATVVDPAAEQDVLITEMETTSIVDIPELPAQDQNLLDLELSDAGSARGGDASIAGTPTRRRTSPSRPTRVTTQPSTPLQGGTVVQPSTPLQGGTASGDTRVKVTGVTALERRLGDFPMLSDIPLHNVRTTASTPDISDVADAEIIREETRARQDRARRRALVVTSAEETMEGDHRDYLQGLIDSFALTRDQQEPLQPVNQWGFPSETPPDDQQRHHRQPDQRRGPYRPSMSGDFGISPVGTATPTPSITVDIGINQLEIELARTMMQLDASRREVLRHEKLNENLLDVKGRLVDERRDLKTRLDSRNADVENQRIQASYALEAVERERLTVTDRLRETTRQVQTQNVQLEELQAEVRRAKPTEDIAALKMRIEQLSSASLSYQHVTERLQGQKDELQHQYDNCLTQKDNLQVRFQENEGQKGVMQTDLETCQERMAVLQTDLANVEQRHTEGQTRLNEAVQQVNDYGGRLSKLKKENKRLSALPILFDLPEDVNNHSGNEDNYRDPSSERRRTPARTARHSEHENLDGSRLPDLAAIEELEERVRELRRNASERPPGRPPGNPSHSHHSSSPEPSDFDDDDEDGRSPSREKSKKESKRRKKRWGDLERFDGAGDYLLWLKNFESTVLGDDWSDYDQRCQLFSWMKDKAQRLIITYFPKFPRRCTYPQLLARLEKRYASPELKETYIYDFNDCFQEPGQSASDFVEELQHRAAQAYPTEDEKSRRGKVRARFILGCANEKTREELQMMSGPDVGIDNMTVIASRRENVERQKSREKRSIQSAIVKESVQTTQPTPPAVSHAVNAISTGGSASDLYLRKDIAAVQKQLNNFMSKMGNMNPTVTSPPPAIPRSQRAPPSACSACGEWHWYADCPKRRQQNQFPTNPPARNPNTPAAGQPPAPSSNRGGYQGRGRGGYRGKGRGRGRGGNNNNTTSTGTNPGPIDPAPVPVTEPKTVGANASNS
jgi:hypothetical protein